jgi:4-aminobutyrate aminotransferase-like enzyme
MKGRTDLVARRERFLGAGAPLFYEQPVHIVRGEGVWLFDPDGRRYMDLYNNVPCVGHGHPHVVAAIERQLATLNVHSRYLHQGIVDYAERLTGKLSDPLDCAVFACTGTEANEIALAMARLATGGLGIVCTDAAYHGNSAEVAKLTFARSGADPAVRAIPFPQRYRPITDGATEVELSALYVDRVRSAIDDLAASEVGFAGMLVCPILANEGLPDIPAGFMAAAADLVRERGGLFIADEVQAGFCRTGRWWGHEVTDFTPDIVTLGKPMGNGVPLSAAVARRELVEGFRKAKRYFNTFASSPLQAAAGMAVLDVIEREDLRHRAAEVGAYLRQALSGLQSGCEPMAEVRGHGLFIGIEWVSDREARTPDRKGAVTVANRLKDKGFLISNAGARGNVLKIRPPLVFERTHADLFLTAFEETLRELG